MDAEPIDESTIDDDPCRDRVCCGIGCQYKVHPDAKFGGWCCMRCFSVNVWQAGETPKGKHGNRCSQERWEMASRRPWHWELPIARPRPDEWEHTSQWAQQALENPQEALKQRSLRFYSDHPEQRERVRNAQSWRLPDLEHDLTL